MVRPKVLVLTGYGINCDEETKYAFELAGAMPDIVHINDLIDKKFDLSDYQILAFPGGFSFGDDTGSGRALANRIKNNLWADVQKFVDSKLVIGICNGFQVLANLGLLPALDGKYGVSQVALTHNTSARYECRWVELLPVSSKCVWTKSVEPFEVPVAHGEGNFYSSPELLARLQKEDSIVFRYAKNRNSAKQEFPFNPNGSIDDIAAICDASGKILGMMPHPERACEKILGSEDGLRLFESIVKFKDLICKT